jgi:hypothetical protein
MKLSSSLLFALMGGPCVSAAFLPPMERNAMAPTELRVAIASYTSIISISSSGGIAVCSYHPPGEAPLSRNFYNWNVLVVGLVKLRKACRESKRKVLEGRTIWLPTCLPAIVYMATIFAVGCAGVRGRGVEGQWMRVVEMRAGGDDLLMERDEVEVSRMSKRVSHTPATVAEVGFGGSDVRRSSEAAAKASSFRSTISYLVPTPFVSSLYNDNCYRIQR